MMTWFALACGFTLLTAMLALAVAFLPTQSREAERMLSLVRSSREDRRRIGFFERVSTLLVAQAGQLGRYVGVTQNAKLTRRLQQAGLRGDRSGETFITVQLLGLVAGCFVGSRVPGSPVFCAFAGAVVGFMGPDFWLNSKVNGRRERMRRSVPDAIDLLVICVNAGLGLDQALLRVGEELNISHRELNEEFNRLKLERQAGKPRTDAWKDLAERTHIEELTTFATILSETDRFGTPITEALTAFAEEVRSKRRQLAEEAAAKTKIKIIFPLVLCIFPCILLVLLGPAILSLMHTLGGMQR